MEKLGICLWEGCDKPVHIRKSGLCAAHYQRARYDEMTEPCLEDGCDRTAQVKGMCFRHYQLHRREGTLPDKDYGAGTYLSEQQLQQDHIEARRRKLIMQLKRLREADQQTQTA